MGKTVTKIIKRKNLDLIEEALISKFGWDRKFFKKISEEDQAKGKSFKVVGHRAGGIVAEDEVELYGGKGTNNPVVWKIDREHISNKQGEKAVWSGFAIAKTPEGYYETITDEHNIGGDSSKILSISDELIEELDNTYVEKAIEKHIGQIPTAQVIQKPIWAGGKMSMQVKVKKRVLRQNLVPVNNFL